jgi:hypothetical protein
MKSKYLVSSALVALIGCSLPLVQAHASFVSGGYIKGPRSYNGQGTVVLADSVGFIKGTQIFTDTFDVTTPGVLSVSLSAIPWLDTLQDLNCFFTSPSGGVMPGTFSGNLDSVKVLPGDISVNWYGTAAGTFGVGVYGLKVDFQPAVPVPVPATLPLLLSGLGALWALKRNGQSRPPAC